MYPRTVFLNKVIPKSPSIDCVCSGYCEVTEMSTQLLQKQADYCNDKKLNAKMASDRSNEMYFSIFVKVCMMQTSSFGKGGDSLYMMPNNLHSIPRTGKKLKCEKVIENFLVFGLLFFQKNWLNRFLLFNIKLLDSCIEMATFIGTITMLVRIPHTKG